MRSFYPGAALPQPRFGLLRVRSPLLAQSLLFSFPPGNEMFQFPGLASRLAGRHAKRAGLPHSDIRGSMGICPCPRLFAACHVLLRLREPRHPSCALLSFPFFLFGESRLACLAPDVRLCLSPSRRLFLLKVFLLLSFVLLLVLFLLVCVHSGSLCCSCAPMCLRCFHSFQHVNVLFSKSGE